MTSQVTLMETMDLENKLVLRVYDGSRKIAGDRWQVCLTAKIDVPVETAGRQRPGQPVVEMDTLKATLGETVEFEKKTIRNFIDDTEKDSLLQEIRDSLVETIVPYLSHPDFPARYVLKRFKEKSLAVRRP